MSRKKGFSIGLLASSPILMAFTSPLQGAGGAGIPAWAWLLGLIVLLLLLALLIWWVFSRIPEEKPAPPAPKPAAAPVPPKPAPPAPKPVAPPKPDDLKIVEGIGPKIADLLATAGITTFVQLAAADVGRLKQILEEAGLGYLADPATWPEQARLAGAGDWATLEKLQDELKGGRRA